MTGRGKSAYYMGKVKYRIKGGWVFPAEMGLIEVPYPCGAFAPRNLIRVMPA